MADNVITNLSIEVTSSADKAASVFDRLASSAGRVKGAASGAAGGMRDMAQGAKDAGTATATAGTQAGRAEPRIRSTGKAAKDAGDNAKKGSKGIEFFWNQLKRVALYRAIRSVIREITDAFKTGITNLYHWSDLVNGHFAASMDRLATSSQYLKNSLGAMVSPLIETLVPVLDVIIDKVVDVLNFFNMLVSAVSGAGTYTVAKKAAAVWDDSANKTRKAAKSAADDIKRTILGFDEINKLVKPNSSSGGSGSSYGKSTPNYSAMFEEKPLTGIFKKISDITNGWPDWLKALLGVGTAGLAIFGIPALLKTIWNWLKKLFALDIPNWFKWLFGPKGNGDGNINLPDEIKLPDADVGVNLKKRDWGLLKELDNKDCDVDVDLKKGWNLIRGTTPAAWAWSFGHKMAVNVDLDKVWKYASPAVWAWKFGHDMAVNVDLDRAWSGASPAVWAWKLGHNMVVNVDLDKAWKGASPAVWAWDKGHNLTLNVDLKKAWEGSSPAVWAWNFGHKLVDEVGLKKDWDGASPAVWAWQLGHNLTLSVDLKKVWDGASPGVWAWNLGHNLTVVVDLKRGWDGTSPAVWAWNFGHRLVNEVGLKRDWDGASPAVWAWSFGHRLVVEVDLKKIWDGASPGVWAFNLGHRLTLDVDLKKDWEGASPGVWAYNLGHKLAVDVGLKKDWEGASPGVWAWNLGHKLTVDVSLKKDNWTTVTDYVNDNFGGGTGGGGKTSGGGAGRFRVNVGLEKDWNGSATQALGLDNLNSTVDVDVWSPWLYWKTSPIKWLQMDNLESTVRVEMWTPWWSRNESALHWLQMDNLVATVDVVANVTNAQNTIKAATNFSGSYKAKGGVFSNNSWTDIPQYAGGTLNAHGSLFLAGEAGPEIIGHVGGRTEVLNKSQLASAMYSAVNSAMQGVTLDANFYGGNMDGDINGESLAEMMEYMRADADAMRQQNDLLRQQNDLLRQINEKDMSVSTAAINRAQAYMNRRAGTTIVPVGT